MSRNCQQMLFNFLGDSSDNSKLSSGVLCGIRDFYNGVYIGPVSRNPVWSERRGVVFGLAIFLH